jgi:hypothetical protein
MKDDECGRSKYKGENMSEWNEIFRFEGEDKGERVWIVYSPGALPGDPRAVVANCPHTKSRDAS